MRVVRLYLWSVLITGLCALAFCARAHGDQVEVCSQPGHSAGDGGGSCVGAMMESVYLNGSALYMACVGASALAGSDCGGAGGSLVLKQYSALGATDQVNSGCCGFELVSAGSFSPSDSAGGVLPPLSESDGYQIAYAVVGLWAVAYGLTEVRRALHRR